MPNRPPIDWTKYELGTDSVKEVRLTGAPVPAEKLFGMVYQANDVVFVGEQHNAPEVRNFKGKVIQANNPDMVGVEGINRSDQEKLDRDRHNWHFSDDTYDKAMLSLPPKAIVATDTGAHKFEEENAKLTEYGQMVSIAKEWDKNARGGTSTVTREAMGSGYEELLEVARANPEIYSISKDGNKVSMDASKLSEQERANLGAAADKLLTEAEKVRGKVEKDIHKRDGDSKSNRNAADAFADAYEDKAKELGRKPKAIEIYGADHYRLQNDLDELTVKEMKKDGFNPTSAVVNVLPTHNPKIVGKGFKNVSVNDETPTRPTYTVFVSAEGADKSSYVETKVSHDGNYDAIDPKRDQALHQAKEHAQNLKQKGGHVKDDGTREEDHKQDPNKSVRDKDHKPPQVDRGSGK